MFSGIVETVGTIRKVEPGEGATGFLIGAPNIAGQLELGDSVAIDGACMTVESLAEGAFAVTAVATTLDRTIAASYAVGTSVNLERALRVGDRLDGHFVQGHVDGVGVLRSRQESARDVRFTFTIPEDIARMTLPRGSITLNGVSLTVAEGPGGEGDRHVGVALIPFTLEATNLGDLTPGDAVNVEGDLIGKYVGRMVASAGGEG